VGFSGIGSILKKINLFFFSVYFGGGEGLAAAGGEGLAAAGGEGLAAAAGAR
jgi:hypothetical protein